MTVNSVTEIIEDIRQGKMVIIMDDEDRENEGDLVMASSLVNDKDINFMAKYGRGLICMTLTKARCEKLKLPLMVAGHHEHSTNFTVSIEAAEGVTTGISSADRAVTVKAAVAVNAKAQDVVQPGHIFPLMAKTGGVLIRAGHTEAGCDLARLAGLEPSSVIVEILNEDGTMARLPDLRKFAEMHQLKMGTIEDLIRYRVENEKTIEKVNQCLFQTEYGEAQLHAYRDLITEHVHFALLFGDIDANEPIAVRVHMEDTFCDLLSLQGGDCGWPLQDAMASIAKRGRGVIVLLRHLEKDADLLSRMQSLLRHSDAKSKQAQQLRTYGVGAQIIADLGVVKMLVMSAPVKVNSLAGFGLEIVDYIAS